MILLNDFIILVKRTNKIKKTYRDLFTTQAKVNQKTFKLELKKNLFI